jgi:hypothetical protein
MGMNDRRQDAREVKRNAKRQRNVVPEAAISVDDINSDTLLYCLHHVLAAGGAIRIGATRDKGAWAIGVYGDGTTPYTEYVRPAEDFNSYLRGLGEFFAKLEAPEK